MGNPFDPMNILLVVFAVVAFIRLRTTLGKRTGNEEPLPGKKLAANQQNGKQEPSVQEDHIKPTTSDTLSQISKIDKNFSQASFIDGAKSVYKMIIDSYAKGELDSVKKFLSKDVYSGFSSAVKSRNKLEQKLFNEIITFDSVNIQDASIQDDKIEITVLFETKIISYAIDKNDQTIEGNQDSPQSIIDSWVFERSIKSRDLNWILVSTNSDD